MFEIMIEGRPHIPLLMEYRKNTLKGGIEETFIHCLRKLHNESWDHMASLPTLIEYTYFGLWSLE